VTVEERRAESEVEVGVLVAQRQGREHHDEHQGDGHEHRGQDRSGYGVVLRLRRIGDARGLALSELRFLLLVALDARRDSYAALGGHAHGTSLLGGDGTPGTS
jgi:hypothetical protein